jgi:hypothetical protein
MSGTTQTGYQPLTQEQALAFMNHFSRTTNTQPANPNSSSGYKTTQIAMRQMPPQQQLPTRQQMNTSNNPKEPLLQNRVATNACLCCCCCLECSELSCNCLECLSLC